MVTFTMIATITPLEGMVIALGLIMITYSVSGIVTLLRASRYLSKYVKSRDKVESDIKLFEEGIRQGKPLEDLKVLDASINKQIQQLRGNSSEVTFADEFGNRVTFSGPDKKLRKLWDDYWALHVKILQPPA